MLGSFFKKNHPDKVNVWTKKSTVRLGRKKTALFEIMVPHITLSIITDRDWYIRLNQNPESISEFLESAESNKELSQIVKKIDTDELYYLNGKQILL